jgi:porin
MPVTAEVRAGQLAGGPAYPLAAPGIRIKAEPLDLSVLAAVFSGNPAGTPGAANPQFHNGSGTAFSLSGGTFVISELQYGLNQGKEASGLPGIYKLGGWYHSGRFDDQRFDDGGLSLAAPASSGQPRRHDGDYGVYAVADQMVWRQPGTEDQGLTLFLRLGAAPSDRNLISFYADGGLAYKGLLPGRTQDTLALGVAYAQVGDHARRLDQDSHAVSGLSTPVRAAETALELSYVAQVTPWWTVQPDLQLVFNPGGPAANPNDPTGLSPVGDAVVIGLRTTVKF